MGINSGDMLFKYSVKTGSAGNSTSGTQAGSLGKYVSTTTAAAGTNGTFDDITGNENVASTVDYRCLFILNNHATLTLYNAAVYLSAEVAGGASIALAVDNIAVSAKGSSSAQAAEIASETTAPTGVGTFSSPISQSTALALGDIPAGSVKAFWVRRTAANTVAVDADGVTYVVIGDSAA